MNRDSANARPWYFWPLIALLIGTLIGLIIGWGIWPVKWTNAYPQDLRAAERNEYLAMVAESYAINRNLDLAQARLAAWPGADLAKAVVDLQEVALNTDAKRAADVQLLAAALNLGTAPSAPAPAATPTRAASATQPTAALDALKTVCTAVLWIALVLGAAALFVFLFRRWRAYQQGSSERSVSDLRQSPARGGEPERTTEDIFEEVKAQWPADRAGPGEPLRSTSRQRPPAYTREPEPLDDALAAELPPFMAQREEPSPVVPAPRPVEPRREPPADVPKRTPLQSTSAPVRLGDFIAIYQGEDDYDEAFDINDPVDGYMGQCGLQLNDPVGRGRNQAVALQAWLWDSSDPDTRVKVLMSEGAYRDTGLRSEQAGEHEAVPVRAGTEFSLETHDLLLRGLVERVSYSDQEPYRGVFSEFQVKLQAFRKS